MSRSFVAASLLFLATAVPAVAQVAAFDNNVPTGPRGADYLSTRPLEAQPTNEIGTHVRFAPGTPRALHTVRFGFESWAQRSQHTGIGDENGWLQAMTVNVYAVGPTPTTIGTSPGPILATFTRSVLVPWRPAPSDACGINTQDGQRQYTDAVSGACRSGKDFVATFDMSALGVVLPDEVIVTLATNTQNNGYQPIGSPGPWNSLNLAFWIHGQTGEPADASVGSFGDLGYLSSGFVDGTARPLVSRQLNFPGFGRFEPVLSVSTVVPEPSTYALMASGLVMLSGVMRRRRRDRTA